LLDPAVGHQREEQNEDTKPPKCHEDSDFVVSSQPRET
jgi:hypothetical protein